MDDMKMYQTDNYERLKPTMPKKGSIVGTTTVVPTMDTDEKLIWFDPQGESLYTNPPNPNAPLVDHGLDELQPWAFRKTNYNQIVVHNRHTRDLWSAIKEHNAPWWGKKLAAPHFYTKEKFEKFLSQYALRLDFENLKTRHARELMPGDLAQRDRMQREVATFLANAELKVHEHEMRDVYVTDHKAPVKKLLTLDAEEDQEYYNYMKRLEDYNNQPVKPERVSRFESGRYERGSLKQKLFEPLAGAVTLENGTVFYEVIDKEIAN
jgi:hypothetical protein